MNSQISQADFAVSFEQNIAVIEIPDRLSILEAVRFKETCHQLLEKTSYPQKIIINFDRTKFIDSSGVGALVHNLKAAREKEVQLALENLHPSVMSVLSMTGLETAFEIKQGNHKDVSEKLNRDLLKELPATHPSVRSWIKRSIDIVGSLVGLAITAILFVPIAIAIKINSPGPIFFGQTRCGWMGKRFKMWKFRSMCANAEQLKSQIANQASGAIFKNDNDPRITKVGSFLRKTSLDELPQFWNVLKGEMSLVGTRPPTPDEVEVYEVPEWQRLDVKPGMTGEWQVNGRSQVKDFEDVIKLDLRYQQNWSLQYDIKLILKTVLILFNKNSGAM
ncbi:MAG: exopolysaccharide biosynthesis polyprenyl glycosylphosphotransferase [Prochloraceae cyanobacterium]